MEKEYFVHESSYIDEGAKIGKGTKIWYFCHVQERAVIGENCILGQNVFVCNGSKVGNGVKIQNNVSVYECVEIKDNVFIGPSAVFTNDLNPRAKYKKGSSGYKKTVVEEGASIGANATIVCGNVIGRNSFVAAGAVVVDDVPPHAVVAGVPAKRVGWICECGKLLGEEHYCPICRKEIVTNDN